jgi:hypothetical protein
MTWLAGEEMEDVYGLQIGADVPPGDYELSVGMYNTETIERLPVYEASGNVVPEARISLGTIRVVADE